MGRNSHIEHYSRSISCGNWMSSVYFNHDAFDLMFSKDEQGNKTRHTHDGAGRLLSIEQASEDGFLL